jgi:hypothetical protein
MATKKDLSHIHMCVDRILTGEQKIRAMELAIKENKKNQPKMEKLPGVSAHPMKMALQAGKMWADGRLLKVCFMDGSKIQKSQVIIHASQWLKYTNVKFDFASARAKSDIRISFVADAGSWSYIGSDNLGIPKNEPTMNFGWLRDDTDDTRLRYASRAICTSSRKYGNSFSSMACGPSTNALAGRGENPPAPCSHRPLSLAR